MANSSAIIHCEFVLVLAVQVDDLLAEACIVYGFLKVGQWGQEDIVVAAYGKSSNAYRFMNTILTRNGWVL